MSLPDLLSVPHCLQALGSGVPGFIGSVCIDEGDVEEDIKASISHFRDSHGLTFALIHSLRVRVLEFIVSRISTLLEPRTTLKATTEPA